MNRPRDREPLYPVDRHVHDIGDALAPPPDLLQRVQADVEASGGEIEPDPDMVGAIGATMFDLPNSEDGTVTVLLPKEHLQAAPSQALTRIKSRDGRQYLGVVTQGPFAEPDSLRGDSNMLVTIATRGGLYLPPYHGRVQVSLLGEDQGDGSLRPPLLRPLPNSPVFVLDEVESATVLGMEGDIRLGRAANYQDLEVRVPSGRKDVFPRHTAVLGTTGSGKSTTIAGLVSQARAAGMAIILLDVEGEYTYLNEASADHGMRTALARRNVPAEGIPTDQMTLYHLAGRETANPTHPNRRPFSLQFARISPYAASEILELTDAQQDRFHKAYDVARGLLRSLGIFPKPGKADQERLALDIDEFDRGYPRMELAFLIDVASRCLAHLEKQPFEPHHRWLKSEDAIKRLDEMVHQQDLPRSPVSWRVLLSKLHRLNRLKVFDLQEKGTPPVAYGHLLRSGHVSVIDLSDSGMSELSNIVIADLLRGVQEAQDAAYERYETGKKAGKQSAPPTRVLLIIEEAHEFLSAERIEKMPILFQQVARIAKRGRKRWLGLVFVTQLPQHLPRQVFGLVNSYVLHKIADPQVVSALQRTVSGIDDSLWRRLPGLAPGQAIVSFPHMRLPLLVTVDPAPAQLRLVD